jgi:hypothetical protein
VRPADALRELRALRALLGRVAARYAARHGIEAGGRAKTPQKPTAARARRRQGRRPSGGRRND